MPGQIDAELGDEGNRYLEAHFRDIRSSIAQLAAELADRDGTKVRPIKMWFITRAAEEFAPGTRIQPCPPRPDTLRHRLTDGLNGVTLIGAVLALAFALMALTNPIPSQQSSFIDLAKLMVGVVVGSGAGAVATTVATKGRTSRLSE